mmetsp:Transcript_20470/g.33025  ORF Transcript_20470/g.33025 Transcript_20470/m.33025 type:complete len:177 (-) Transcript_20470:808-1338(-)
MSTMREFASSIVWSLYLPNSAFSATARKKGLGFMFLFFDEGSQYLTTTTTTTITTTIVSGYSFSASLDTYIHTHMHMHMHMHHSSSFALLSLQIDKKYTLLCCYYTHACTHTHTHTHTHTQTHSLYQADIFKLIIIRETQILRQLLRGQKPCELSLYWPPIIVRLRQSLSKCLTMI